MSDKSYLDWPFLEDRHRKLKAGLDDWIGTSSLRVAATGRSTSASSEEEEAKSEPDFRADLFVAVNTVMDDELIGVALTSGEDHVLLFSDAGRVIRFKEGDVRSMGRGATGVRGMRLIRASSEIEEAAADEVVQQRLVDMGADGGIIGLDPSGTVVYSFNSKGMYRASQSSTTGLHAGIYQEE